MNIILQGLASALLVTQGYGSAVVPGGPVCVHATDEAVVEIAASDTALVRVRASDRALVVITASDEGC